MLHRKDHAVFYLIKLFCSSSFSRVRKVSGNSVLSVSRKAFFPFSPATNYPAACLPVFLQEIRPAKTKYSGTQKFFLLRRNSRKSPMTKKRFLHSENSSQRALPPIQCAGPLSPALQGKSLLNFSGHVTGRMSDLTMQRNCWD